MANIPFGYRLVEGRLAPHPSEAPVLLRLFELFAEHGRKKTVARLLNESGARTRSGSPFSDTAVGRLIRDARAKGGAGRSPAAEAVVPPELWDRCNGMLAVPAARMATHLFAGLAVCACGSKMYVPAKSRKLVCQGCRRKIPADDLEHVFVGRLRHHVLVGAGEASDLSGGARSDPVTLGDVWPRLSEEKRMRLVEALLRSVTVADGRVTLHVRDPLKDASSWQQNDPPEEKPRSGSRSAGATGKATAWQQSGGNGEKGEKSAEIPGAAERIRLDVSARELYVGETRLTGKLTETTRNFVAVLGLQIASRADAPLPWDEPFSEDATATARSAVRMLQKQVGRALAERMLRTERRRGAKPGGVRLAGVEISGTGRRDFLTRS